MESITATLGLNWNGLIWQAINFIVLLLLLRQFLFKPVVGMLDARAQRVRVHCRISAVVGGSGELRTRGEAHRT